MKKKRRLFAPTTRNKWWYWFCWWIIMSTNIEFQLATAARRRSKSSNSFSTLYSASWHTARSGNDKWMIFFLLEIGSKQQNCGMEWIYQKVDKFIRKRKKLQKQELLRRSSLLYRIEPKILVTLVHFSLIFFYLWKSFWAVYHSTTSNYIRKI